MATYSFINVNAAIEGPGGAFSLGYGSGNAEEGITTSMVEDKDTMTIGADGAGMHSLHAGKAGTVTIRLLQTAPANQQLSLLYDYQQLSSANWGQNIVTIRDSARGDVIVCQGCAFKKVPDLTYAKDGGTVEWVFNSIQIDTLLGKGTN